MMSNFHIPPQILNMLKCGNPKQIAINMLQQNSNNNPMFENLMNAVNNDNESEITTICKNILRSKGYNPDELMNDFQNQIR